MKPCESVYQTPGGVDNKPSFQTGSDACNGICLSLLARQGRELINSSLKTHVRRSGTQFALSKFPTVTVKTQFVTFIPLHHHQHGTVRPIFRVCVRLSLRKARLTGTSSLLIGSWFNCMFYMLEITQVCRRYRPSARVDLEVQRCTRTSQRSQRILYG